MCLGVMPLWFPFSESTSIGSLSPSVGEGSHQLIYMMLSDPSTNVAVLPEPGRTIVRNGPATWTRMSGCCKFMCLKWWETV